MEGAADSVPWMEQETLAADQISDTIVIGIPLGLVNEPSRVLNITKQTVEPSAAGSIYAFHLTPDATVL